jgi:hypothetical protein
VYWKAGKGLWDAARTNLFSVQGCTECHMKEDILEKQTCSISEGLRINGLPSNLLGSYSDNKEGDSLFRQNVLVDSLALIFMF